MTVMTMPWVVKELTFPVPWGIIAAKGWGEPCASPVIVLHGIQDNAGSFERLIPYLPRAFYYVCIDLPGHGLSSHFPKGFHIEFTQYVLSVQRVIRQLKWIKYIIMGHSFGGQISQYYSAMYPDEVEKMIVLDAYGPYPVKPDEHLSYHRQSLEQLLNIEEKMFDSNPPTYSYETALEKTLRNRKFPITKEAAEMILPRNLMKGKNGYYFSLDQRLKFPIHVPVSFQQLVLEYSNIICPFLLIMTNSLSADATARHINYLELFRGISNIKLVMVEGVHDVHNVSPEVVAPIIVEFLLLQRAHL